MFVEYIYEQYNPETTRRNTSKLKHSTPIEKTKHLLKQNWQLCYKVGLHVPHRRRHVIALLSFWRCMRARTVAKKGWSPTHLDMEGDNTSFRMTCFVICATVRRRLIFFLLPFFSLSQTSVYVQSFD
jgi:hypothetical protein